MASPPPPPPPPPLPPPPPPPLLPYLLAPAPSQSALSESLPAHAPRARALRGPCRRSWPRARAHAADFAAELATLLLRQAQAAAAGLRPVRAAAGGGASRRAAVAPLPGAAQRRHADRARSMRVRTAAPARSYPLTHIAHGAPSCVGRCHSPQQGALILHAIEAAGCCGAVELQQELSFYLTLAFEVAQAPAAGAPADALWGQCTLAIERTALRCGGAVVEQAMHEFCETFGSDACSSAIMGRLRLLSSNK